MDMKRFGEMVDAIKEQAKDVQHEDSYIKFLCKEYYECKDEFDDERENLLRWLLGEPCEFYHSKMDREFSIMIDDDYETMYIFLVIVQFATLGKSISDKATEFLDTLIRRSIEEHGDDENCSNEIPEDYPYDEEYEDEDYFDEENYPDDYPFTEEERALYGDDDYDDYDEEDDDEYLDEDIDYGEEKYEFADFD